MKKVLAIFLFLVFSVSSKAADLNMLQILQISNFLDIGTSTIPQSDQIITDTQPVYLVGYYFMDTRFQNIGEDKWLFRGLFKMKGIFLTSRYIPDIRYVYVENKKPVGGHWFFSAGRINPLNLLPVQRLDGAHIGYTPDSDKGWLFGLVGGMVPVETSGYRNLYYNNEPFRVGGYAEYRNKESNHYKLQYNAGFGGPGTDLFHQGQLEITQKYKIFNMNSFLRGGILYTYPYNTFDYAFAENSLYTSSKVIHSIGYLKSETVFLSSQTNTKVDFQQAFYRFNFRSDDDAWSLNLRGGYTYSMEMDGFIAQVQIMRKKLFSRQNGNVSLDLLGQKKGSYQQYLAKANFGLIPLGFVNINAYGGYEFFKYNTVITNSAIFGLNLSGEFAAGFSYDVNVDFRSIESKSTEVYLNFNLVHLLHVPLGKKEADVSPSSLEGKDGNKALTNKKEDGETKGNSL